MNSEQGLPAASEGGSIRGLRRVAAVALGLLDAGDLDGAREELRAFLRSHR